MKRNIRYLIGAFFVLLLIGLRYFGDYPVFVQEVFAMILQSRPISAALSQFAGFMSYSVPDEAWLTARFVVLLSFFINYAILSLFMNKNTGMLFLKVSLALFLLSAVISPLNLIETRGILYDFTATLSQPYLILIVYPLSKLYRYYSTTSSTNISN